MRYKSAASDPVNQDLAKVISASISTKRPDSPTLTRHVARYENRGESSHSRGPKTVPAQTGEVMSFSLFSLDFKPKVLVVMLFLW